MMDQKYEDWRSEYVIMFDNATTHSTKLAQTVLAKYCDVPVIYTAPRSYLCSPIERVFGFLKQADLGEKNFGSLEMELDFQ